MFLSMAYIWTSVRLSCQQGKRMRGVELTERQRQVLKAIRAHVGRTGMAPTRTELARSLGFQFGSGVTHHLQALERKGWIQINAGVDRGIQLLREGTPVFDPGTLATGPARTPALADESAATFRVPDQLAQRIHPQADFYLLVQGDSMNLVGYGSDDIVAVRRTPNANDGDIVVARIGTEITLKCFHQPSADRIKLQPRSDNPEHRPIVLESDTEDWEIVGVVVGAMTGTPADCPSKQEN